MTDVKPADPRGDAALYARQAAKMARDWLRTRLSDARPATLHIPAHVAITALVVVAAPGRRPYHPLQRRGPPALSC